MSPSAIYKLISKTTALPSNLGRETLQELSDIQKIDLNKAISTLKAKGLVNVSSDSKIKNIADDLNIMTIDVYKLLI